ncbi:MAG: hypothetical protein ACJATT_005975 [Myxococcota bacterium]
MTYSDLAIVRVLTLRTVFHLPLRQAEGFVASRIRLIGLKLETPDHTTLSRRSSQVEVPRMATVHDGPLHLVIDSTGLKMLGDGEWHADKHKTSNRRRRWRKLHLAVDSSGFIVASKLTERRADDGVVGVQMLEGLDARVERFTADGAYNSRPVYEAVDTAGTPDVRVVIPPSRRAATCPGAMGAWRQRTEAVERISQVGRRAWRKESGAHHQARGENGMFRYKPIIGDRLRAKKFEWQVREALIAVNVLNRMTKQGRPLSVPSCLEW